MALPHRLALVFGAEDRGLRRLVRESCDDLVRIPIDAATDSLNVGTAAAIGLYETARRRRAESRPMTSRLFVPPVVFAAAVLAMLVLHRLLPAPVVVPAAWSWLAVVPAAAGLGVAVAALLAFRRAGTSPAPWAEPVALVQDGPYRFSRNPMYLALLLWLIALAVGLGSLAPPIVVPAFVLVMNATFIRREERLLHAHYGPAFAAYRARVRRWL